MKNIAINELNHFEFHDAELKNASFTDGKMTWHVCAVNVTVQNSQNTFDKDMCIEEAELIFENYHIEKIVFGGYKVFDSNNNLIKSVEEKVIKPDEYNDALKDILNDSYIFGMEELPKNGEETQCFRFDIDNCYLTFSFTKSIVQWEEYRGIAWYEDEKWKKK